MVTARMWLASFTVAVVLLLVCGYSTAENNNSCIPAPPDFLINGTGTLDNGVPIINFSDTSKCNTADVVIQCISMY